MKQRIRKSMAFSVIVVIVLVLAVFGLIVSSIGFMSFTSAFKKEYSISTYHMADTAAILINGDHLDEYLAGEEQEEYLQTKQYLDIYCKKINVSLIYVIQVDQSDYGRFVSIFNPVDNTVDDSEYVEWELGHKRDTTNDEYREKYRALYEKKAVYETVYRTKPTDGQHPHITTMVPVLGSDGTVQAILCMQRPIHELEAARRPYLIKIAIFTALLCVFAALLTILFIRRHVIAPIRKVSEEASRFARENTKEEELGQISRYEEIADLASSIDKMETDMVNYIDNLTVATAERERIGSELAFARRIQEDTIPHTFPAFPDRDEFDLYASMTPAKAVGGDFYNFFLVDDDHVAMIIGDVSGKGVPAALFMMAINIIVSNVTQMNKTPAEILTFSNNTICKNNKTDMFVTLWIGILEISTGKLTFANAGHEDPVICKKDGDFEIVKTKHGLIVGAFPDVTYKDFEMQLEEGDKLFVFTDGIPEALDQNMQMFTVDRMVDTLNHYKKGTPQEIIEGIHKRVNEFAGEEKQFDDLTMLCLAFNKIK